MPTQSERGQVDNPIGAESPDAELIGRLQGGDEQAFRELVIGMNGGLLRVAEQYVSTRSVAEEVVQDTWIAVIKGLDRFEARSSLRTWIFRIITNIAQTRGAREKRIVPFSNMHPDASDGHPFEPAVEPSRFRSGDHLFDGHWSRPPTSFHALPEDRFTAKETTVAIENAIAVLPSNQRRVVWLRDIEGWTAGEVCEALGLSETNQRVLLHRARSKVRAALECQLFPEGSTRP